MGQHAEVNPLLSLKNLQVSFVNKSAVIQALKGISFDVYPGEVVAIVGESGSGKSVTSLATMGLLPQAARIDSGKIIFQQAGSKPIDLLHLSDAEKRRMRGSKLSMIFQEPMTSLNPVLRIGEQLVEGILNHQRSSREAATAKARKLLERVRISDVDRVLKSFPHTLSGGMRQRVMIALALMGDPDLLIADEPTTALDVTVQARILQILKELQQDSQMSVLFITHDMGVVAEIADRVVVMYRGEIVETGDVETIFKTPQHPYTQALLKAVPKLGDMQDSKWPARFPLPGVPYDAATMEQKTADYDAPPVLEVRNLQVLFPVRGGLLSRVKNEVHAVEHVQFKVWPGETLGIVGESGCGKSTTGRAILRLVDSKSDYIRLMGKEISIMPEAQFQPMRRDIQMVFQDPYASLNPRLTVGFTIAEPLLIHGIAKSLHEASPRVEQLLDSVGLPKSYARRYPHEFSGGQRQRIAIARAMALQPKVIIADEAVSALDVSIQAQVINLMMDLQKEMGISWVFISHDMAVVERIANRVAVMYLGQIVEIGDRQLIFNNPQHPYTQRLLASVPISDPSMRKARTFSNSEIPSPLHKVGKDIPPLTYREVSAAHWVANEQLI